MAESVPMSLTLDQWVSVGVGAASVAAAGATFFLAWKTREMAQETKEVAIATVSEAKQVGRQVEAAEHQIQLSRWSMEATIRPWLTKAITTTERPQTITQGTWDERTIAVHMYVRNVGPGIALIQSGDDFMIQGRDRSGAEVTRKGFADATALPPGETTRVSFVLQNVEPKSFFSQDRNDGEFYVWIPYTDTNGGQLVGARIHATFSRERGMWVFHQIHYFREEENEPFATVVFDAALPQGDAPPVVPG